jgi:hypothetical protein
MNRCDGKMKSCQLLAISFQPLHFLSQSNAQAA